MSADFLSGKPVKPNSFSVGSHGEGLRIPAFAGTCLWGGALAWWHIAQGKVGGESTRLVLWFCLTKYDHKCIFYLCLSRTNTDCDQRKSKKESCWRILTNVAFSTINSSVPESKHGKTRISLCPSMTRRIRYHC